MENFIERKIQNHNITLAVLENFAKEIGALSITLDNVNNLIEAYEHRKQGLG